MFPFRISAVTVLSFRRDWMHISPVETASYSPYKQDWLHGEGWKLRPHVGKRRQTRVLLDRDHLRSYPLSSPATCMASPVMSFAPQSISVCILCVSGPAESLPRHGGHVHLAIATRLVVSTSGDQTLGSLWFIDAMQKAQSEHLYPKLCL
ncbi:hypothetical protein ARMSODRAFT_627593 [Armillaria solidipes]|uniref:Uncharacterized protein n=1 Tax=Armillaria solidipes TaxID=1076256 RepID=A0A2H3C256_9AGAR|nr:hypothetical protein ARMSODRAFT_627593 [Armillaria solidipes]